MPNNSPEIPIVRMPQILKDAASRPILPETEMQRVLSGKRIGAPPLIDNPEGIIAALKSGNPELMGKASAILTEDQRSRQKVIKGKDNEPRTDEVAAAVLEEGRRTGRIKSLEVREDEDNPRILHIKNPQTGNEIRHVPGQKVEAAASMEEPSPLEKLINERQERWDEILDPNTPAGRLAYESNIVPIDQALGVLVQDALRKARLGRIDLTSDIQAIESQVMERFDWHVKNDRKFARDENAKEALLYFIDRATSRAEGSDPSLPVEPQPWEWTGEVPRPMSLFEQTIGVINDISAIPEPLRSAAQRTELQESIERRDALLEEGNKLGLFDQVKTELIDQYYSSRVKVTYKEKMGLEEYRGNGRIALLENNYATRQIEVDGFWPDDAMAERFGGSVDYVYKEGGAMVVSVVRDRNAFTGAGSYPDNGLFDIWKRWNNTTGAFEPMTIVDQAGRALKDDENKDVKAENFDDVRIAVEEARRREPWISRGGDMETWIQFVADDPEELVEMIPHIIEKVQRKLTGKPNEVYQSLTQERDKLDKALVAFPMESDRQFRRVKSTLMNELSLRGAQFFSDQVRKDWGPYIQFMDDIADGFQDSEESDHFIDSAVLDKDGLTILASRRRHMDDGAFWRYLSKDVKMATDASDGGALLELQKKRTKTDRKFLMDHKLRDMSDLLNYDENGIPIGEPNHPAFKRLKEKYEAMDAEDRAKLASGDAIKETYGGSDEDEALTDDQLKELAEKRKTAVIVDASGNLVPRWVEYCQKAKAWQDKGQFGDPRDRDRVTFQHPLARAFRPIGFKIRDHNGKIIGRTTDDEVMAMYEKDNKTDRTDPNYDKWYTIAKRKKVKDALNRADKLARAFMQDSIAALAWHTFNNHPELATQANKYLRDAGEKEIKVDAEGKALEALPHKTLYRAMAQAMLREDEKRVPAKKRFKFSYLLSRIGADLDLPVFAAWYLGAHDSNRPVLMLQYSGQDSQPGGLASVTRERSPEDGAMMDEKNTGAKWAEDERRMLILMGQIIKYKFGASGMYSNYPGHDTKGAGVKDIRNALDPRYGTSGKTSWINDLTFDMITGASAIPQDYGMSRDPITQLVGLTKGIDEVIFKQTFSTGVIESPRDPESSIKRLNTSVEQYKAFTSGNKEGRAFLNDGPFSGMYLWREFVLGAESIHSQEDRFWLHQDPVHGIASMTEPTYKQAIEVAGKVASPLAAIMSKTVESTFGKNPGSAKFINTMLWYAVSRWMDTSWEFREKPGYAVDGNLVVARHFTHTYLKEAGLIYDDKTWDRMMFGYVRKPSGEMVTAYGVNRNGNQVSITDSSKEHWDKIDITLNPTTGNVVQPGYEFYEGYIDAFPPELQKEILAGKDKQIKDSAGHTVHTIKDYWLPFGLDTDFPETMANYYRDSDAVKRDYADDLQFTQPRHSAWRDTPPPPRPAKPPRPEIIRQKLDSRVRVPLINVPIPGTGSGSSHH